MRKRIIIGLIMLNLILGTAIVIGPVAAQILPSSGLFDCCQDRECCNNCCWFVTDCDSDGDCEVN